MERAIPYSPTSYIDKLVDQKWNFKMPVNVAATVEDGGGK